LFGVATHNFFAPLGFDDIVLDDIWNVVFGWEVLMLDLVDWFVDWPYLATTGVEDLLLEVFERGFWVYCWLLD
jgi:hypothetical protein